MILQAHFSDQFEIFPIINHTHAHAIFRSYSALELLKVAKTRFGSHHLLLKRLAQCREALATTVVVRSWKDWVNCGDENARELGKEITSTIKDEEFLGRS